MSGFKFKFEFRFKFAPKLQFQCISQNPPQVPIAWNIRAPALPSVLQNRVRVQRIEGYHECQTAAKLQLGLTT